MSEHANGAKYVIGAELTPNANDAAVVNGAGVATICPMITDHPLTTTLQYLSLPDKGSG